ncbi:hypothetical protein N0V88_007090 [Collariella sp. IMI 366227]|nr:hypothetical protein N0V88_007090 [Collariella sp. IMI 366227]
MDEFSDDGCFEDLNDTVLEELENNALQFTQAQRTQAAPQTQLNAFDYDFEDDDLDDTVVIDETAQQPPRLHPQQSGPVPPAAPPWCWHSGRPAMERASAALSTLISLETSVPAVTAPIWVLSEVPSPTLSTTQPLSLCQASAAPPVPSQAAHAAGTSNQNEVVAALQARLSELESDLTAAKGEAAILRSKYDKTRTTHDAEVARLRKENAEQLAKQERIVEQARAAERKTTTELQFARQDLREELGRVKSRRKDGPGTPRKDRTWGVADGFDGVELLSSPSKGQTLRRKDSGLRTPTKGKRKRPAVDSPTFALETDGGEAVFGDAQTASQPAALLVISSGSKSFDFLRLLLDHTTICGQPPTFDVFSHYAFPSDPSRSLASVILQKLPQMGQPGEPLSLLVEFADLLIEMWHRCLSERYYAPIYFLAALLLYALDLNTVGVARHVISSLIPVCATTCRLVALPRLNMIDGNLADHSDVTVRQLELEINVTQCLSVLYLAALGCLSQPLEEPDAPGLPKPAADSEFWRTMELNFVLLMLSPKLPEANWLGMMALVRTSVAPASIGPIPSLATDSASNRAEPRSPRAVAATMIDCVSSYLCGLPRWASPGSVKEDVVKSVALDTLSTFATSLFGAVQIAESDVAIPRLVTILCWAIDRLYDTDLLRPSYNIEKKQTNGNQVESRTESTETMDVDQHESKGADNSQAATADQGEPTADADDDEVDAEPSPDLLCHIISRTTWLLHFLFTDPRTSDVANMAAKLAASHGGSQRYLLTLARLNFAEEDLVLEAGIGAETVELAHELLELAVTPDEGEEISEMFD